MRSLFSSPRNSDTMLETLPGLFAGGKSQFLVREKSPIAVHARWWTAHPVGSGFGRARRASGSDRAWRGGGARARPGWVFKLGDSGLGYYFEKKAAKKKAKAEEKRIKAQEEAAREAAEAAKGGGGGAKKPNLAAQEARCDEQAKAEAADATKNELRAASERHKAESATHLAEKLKMMQADHASRVLSC